MTAITNEEANTASIIDIFRTMLELRKSAILILVACLAAGIALAVLIDPVYRATITISPSETIGSSDGAAAGLGQMNSLAALAGIGGDQSNRYEEAIAILQSAQFARLFIEKENLLPVLFAGLWDTEKGAWVSKPEDELPSIQDGARMLSGSVLTVIRDRNTGLIDIRVEWGEPELAARWANNMIAMANEYLRQEAIADAEKSVQYLETELGKTTSIEIRSAIFRLMETQIQSIMYANVQDEYAFSVIDPAFAPEADDFVRPNRILIVFLSLIAGLLLAFSFAGVVTFRKLFSS